MQPGAGPAVRAVRPSAMAATSLACAPGPSARVRPGRPPAAMAGSRRASSERTSGVEALDRARIGEGRAQQLHDRPVGDHALAHVRAGRQDRAALGRGCDRRRLRRAGSCRCPPRRSRPRRGPGRRDRRDGREPAGRIASPRPTSGGTAAGRRRPRRSPRAPASAVGACTAGRSAARLVASRIASYRAVVDVSGTTPSSRSRVETHEPVLAQRRRPVA